MEIFRLLGMADKLRGIGLPADYPQRHRLGDERHRHRALPRTHSGAWAALVHRGGASTATVRSFAGRPILTTRFTPL
jgi:hypothetical protein